MLDGVGMGCPHLRSGSHNERDEDGKGKSPNTEAIPSDTWRSSYFVPFTLQFKPQLMLTSKFRPHSRHH